MVFDNKITNSWCCLIDNVDTLQVTKNGSTSIYYSVNVTIEITDSQSGGSHGSPVGPGSCDFGLTGSQCRSCESEGEWKGYYQDDHGDVEEFSLKLTFSAYYCFRFTGKVFTSGMFSSLIHLFTYSLVNNEN